MPYDTTFRDAAVREVLDQVKREGRPALTTPEGKRVCNAYGNQACVDCSYGGTDHPVWLNTGFVQRLINADLVGSQSTAALQHQDDLADVRRQDDTARTGLVNYHLARTGL